MDEFIRVLCRELLAKKRRPLGELENDIGFQKIVHDAAGERRLEVGRFPGLPGAPEERRLALGQIQLQYSMNVQHRNRLRIGCAIS